MNLIDLPDLCLRTIVKRLPPTDQLLIGVLCRRMYAIQQSVIATICQKKTSLRIDSFDNRNCYKLGDDDFFQLDTDCHDLFARWSTNPKTPVGISTRGQQAPLVECTANYDFTIDKENLLNFSKTYPNICQLTLSKFLNVREMETDFIDKYKILSCWPNLKSLKFLGCYEMDRLTTILNQLKSLKTLSIDMGLEDVAKLEIMPQLEELNCRIEPLEKLDDEVEDSSTQQYWSYMLNCLIDKHKNLKRIGLWIEYFDGIKFEFSRDVISKLHRLAIRQPFTLSDFYWIASNYHGVNYLDFELSVTECFPPDSTQLVFPDIISKLSRFPSLSELKMYLISTRCLELDEQEVQNLPQLPLIKRVQAQFMVDPHKLHLLESIFANAEQITFTIPDRFFATFKSFLCEPSETICEVCHKIKSLIEKCGHYRANTILLNIKPSNVQVGQLMFIPS